MAKDSVLEVVTGDDSLPINHKISFDKSSLLWVAGVIVVLGVLKMISKSISKS